MIETNTIETNTVETNTNIRSVRNGKKWIFDGIIVLLLSSIIAWAAWMTDKVYSQSTDQAVSRETVEAIKSDVKSTKEGLETFKKEVGTKFDVLTEKVNQGQLETMKILREIDKKVK